MNLDQPILNFMDIEIKKIIQSSNFGQCVSLCPGGKVFL